MTSILSTNAVWLLIGLDIVLLGVLGAMLFLYMRNKRRDTAGLSELVRTIKENEPAQLEALRSTLKEQYGQSEEVAAENAKKLAKVKKAFYKHLIHVHTARDSEAFASLDPRLDELLTAYRSLMPVTAEPAEQPAAEEPGAAAPTDDKDFGPELEEIKRQNDELKKELEEAKRSLDEALNEYASAYSGGAEAGKERLENEMHKLHDKAEPPPTEETTAAPAPDAGQPGDAQQPAKTADAAPEAPVPDKAAGAPEPAAPAETEAQNQDEIDQLMNGIPNLDGILVQEEEDGGQDNAADTTDPAAAPPETDSKPEDQAAEKQT